MKVACKVVECVERSSYGLGKYTCDGLEYVILWFRPVAHRKLLRKVSLSMLQVGNDLASSGAYTQQLRSSDVW